MCKLSKSSFIIFHTAASNFHYVVQRKALRDETQAWSLVLASGGSIPEEFKAWVEAGRSNSFFMEEKRQEETVAEAA
jgi:hypothetical protein